MSKKPKRAKADRTPAAASLDVSAANVSTDSVPSAPDGAAMYAQTPKDLRAKEDEARNARVEACRKNVAAVLDEHGCMLDWTASIERGVGPDGLPSRVIVSSVGIRSK